jgi:hypothetical protein
MVVLAAAGSVVDRSSVLPAASYLLEAFEQLVDAAHP